MGRKLLKVPLMSRKILVCTVVLFSILAVNITAAFPLQCYANDDDFDIAIYYPNGHTLKYSDVDDKLLEQFMKEYENITSSEQKWVKSTNASYEYSVGFYEGNSYYYLFKYVGANESYIESDENYYETSDTLDSLVEALINSDATLYMEPDEYLLTYTALCTEPQTEEEYVSVAEDIASQWLEYLKTVDDEYRIKTYTFDKNYAANESRLLADGYVNGLREFTVEVRFDVDGIPDNSVFYDETGYNTYYSYYFGPMVILRLRWQDGVCSVVDYDDAYMGAMYGGSLLDNLYGIRTSENSENYYATFYEFMNDTENLNSYLTNGTYSRLLESTISHNVLMLSNGSIYYADIGSSSSYGEPKYSDGVYTGKFARQFYDINGDSTYGSPVTYDDSTQSPNTLKFHDDFSLIFDDYNNDGNPDYTIKIGEDENGSTYCISCMSNDGTPRADPYDNEIYLAGCFDDSVRLQRYEDGYVRWNYGDDGKLTPSTTLDDYRMYSQRYYEPDGLNTYADDTQEIICYLWNNTDKAVQFENSYSIEQKTGGDWVSISENLSISDTDIINDSCFARFEDANTGVPAYSHAAISFDVPAVSASSKSEYRIALTLKDGQTVYGGFYMGDATISGDNDGTSSDDNSGGNSESFWYHFEDNPTIDKQKNGATVTLTNKISTKETASDVSPRSFYVLENGKWEPLYCDISFEDDDKNSGYYRDIAYGDSVSVNIAPGDVSYSSSPSALHRYVFFGSIIEGLQQVTPPGLSSGLFSLYLALELLYSQVQNSSSGAGLPDDGDVCRLELSVDDYSEYVYFTY
jgi:hypothetical protein